jgi:hypothetical protein
MVDVNMQRFTYNIHMDQSLEEMRIAITQSVLVGVRSQPSSAALDHVSKRDVWDYPLKYLLPREP